MYGNAQYDPNTATQWTQQQQPAMEQEAETNDLDDGDNSHRPPNAFILFSQEMRSSARQRNPALSNTEISRILGQMWKEVSSDVKLQYKAKAAKLQQEFKKNHPNYTYRKARRKRALNELLTKSSSAFPPMFTGMDQMQMMQMMQNPASVPGYPQMAGQPQQQMMGAMPPYNGMPMMQGMPGQMPGQMSAQIPGQMPGMEQQMPPQMQGMQPQQMYQTQMAQYPQAK